MPTLQDAISQAVDAQPGHVSIAEAIRRVRQIVRTSAPDVELQNLIGTAAAYRWKPILFDRVK
ncbi:hypothetical protein X728_14895 [Mesorhizobium sp. L103C120A0]|nr:hypothetical protein X728_14895 [Mesorhizobium sp. L103C120A0]